MNRKELGRLGEDAAAELLELKGYVILARNFRCRLGEVDLIARKDGRLSFIEVKTRTDAAFGLPVESVSDEKIARIRRVAGVYLNQVRPYYKSLAVEVVEVGLHHIADI